MVKKRVANPFPKVIGPCPCGCEDKLRRTNKALQKKYAWYKCKTCNHWFLNMPQEVNMEFQARYHERLPDSEGVERGGQRMERIRPFICGAKSVVDIGCGDGYLLAMLPIANRVGLVLDKTVTAQDGPTYLQGDFLTTDCGVFDVVMAWHVLEHIGDIRKAMKRMISLAKPGGTVIFELPVDRHLDIKEFLGHLHRFSKESVRVLCDTFSDDLDYLMRVPGCCNGSVLVIARRR